MLLRISLVRISYVAFGSFLLLLLVMGSAEHVSAQGLKFMSPVTYPAGSPYVITSGDFNGDGKVDLVAGSVTDSQMGEDYIEHEFNVPAANVRRNGTKMFEIVRTACGSGRLTVAVD